MGLLDNVLGSQIPGGNLAKPLGMALLGYLASRSMGAGGSQAPSGGGLGGLLGGLMGGSGQQPGPEAHAAASGGLGALLERFQQSGYGDVANSWIGRGRNQPIAPDELQEALGPETVNDFARQTGVSQEEALSQLSEGLPTLVDRLTPEGRIPDEQEMASSQPNRQF